MSSSLASSAVRIIDLSSEVNRADWGQRILVLGALAAEAKALAAKVESLLEAEFSAVGLPLPA